MSPPSLTGFGGGPGPSVNVLGAVAFGGFTPYVRCVPVGA
jgi:hypothetical protein